MLNPLKESSCCCQIFYLKQGVFFIAAHTFVQGTFGLLFTMTSYYSDKKDIVNIIFLSANISFFPAGILVFGTSLYNSPRAIRFSAFFFSVVTAFNCGAAFCYTVWYYDYTANSNLDKIMFWKNDHDFVTEGELPFTFWHVFATSNCVILQFWWYYSYQLWRFGNLMKAKNDLEESSFGVKATRRRSTV